MSLSQALFNVLDKELSMLGFPRGCGTYADSSVKQRAADALRNSFLRKWEGHGKVPDKCQSRAILDFLENMHRLSSYKLVIPDSVMEQVHGDVRMNIYNFWNVTRPDGVRMPLITQLSDVGTLMRPGPGASIGVKHTDFYSKLFDSPLTATTDSLTFWYNSILKGTLWGEAESIRLALHGHSDRLVQGSRLSVVPKNDETGRCTCTEPNINMLFQLGIGETLSGRLSRVYRIDLTKQERKNQALARKGSLGLPYATLDLKSASDSISLELLNQILPADMLRILLQVRSPSAEIPGLGEYKLPIVSTMGNGYTFPLQTLIFTCIVHACYKAHDIPFDRNPDTRSYGVYGDDIICDVRIVNTLKRALSMYGFVVNMNKSYHEGEFRESCGGDFFRGCNIRGFYLKRLSIMQDFYVAINGLNLWSTRTGIYIPRTVRFLLARCKWVPVPRWESEDAGIRIPYSMVAKRLKLDRFTHSPLYRYYSVKPVSIKVPETVNNPPGALVAFLGGYIRNGLIVRRLHKLPLYSLRWNVAPGWDVPADPEEDPQWFLGQRWNTAVALNLYG